MAGRIVTARHGRPALDRSKTMGWRDYGRWWSTYEETGLGADEHPPEKLVDIGRAADVVISSTRPRAIETARRTAGDDRAIAQRALFVECPLPAPPLPFVQLRPGPWGVVSRTYWFAGYAPDGAENHIAAWKRASAAADDLIARAEDGDVLLCAHGYLNWMIDKAIRWKGWRRVYDGGSHYWAWREYEAPKERAVAAQSSASEAGDVGRRAAE